MYELSKEEIQILDNIIEEYTKGFNENEIKLMYNLLSDLMSCIIKSLCIHGVNKNKKFYLNTLDILKEHLKVMFDLK